MKELPYTKDTKELLQDVSSQFGLRVDVIKQVWEATLVTLFLKMAENPEAEHELQIPFIGKLKVKYKNSCSTGNSGYFTIVDSEIFLDEEFKNIVGDVYYQGNTPLIDYIQNTLIKNTLENIKNQPMKTPVKK